MINPTVGRVVHFKHDVGDKPLAAIVTAVHDNRCVNLAVFDYVGQTLSRTSVTLLQDDDEAPISACFCEWMPYQKGQAAKTEALESKVDLMTAPPSSL